MTESFRIMLRLLQENSGVHSESFDIEKIRKAALSQGVWTLVYPELEKYADVSMYLQEFMVSVTQGIQKNAFQLQILTELKEAGFDYCLLKGAAVAALYPHPEYRISSDTDILIKPEDEQAITDFLKGKGYIIKPREKNDHHFKAYHPIGGLLEGHVRLYSVPTEKILLDGLDLYGEEFSELEIEGFKVPILGLNDGLMYLTAHYIKHLVNEGGGVRQMLDLLVYMEHYKDELDFERYNELLKRLRYDKLIDVVKTVGAKYWGFDYPMKHEELADEILTDSEKGGIFGYDTDERKGFYSLYCEKRAGNSLKSKAMLIVKNERGLKNLFFPPQEVLLGQKEYQYAKNKLMLPVAWVHRFCVIILKRLKNDGTEVSGVDKRLKMMRELNMIN